MRLFSRRPKEKKYLTFMIVSNSRGKTWRFVISARTIRVLAVAACLFSVLMVSVLVDYTGLLLQSTNNKHLQTENIYLRREFQIVQSKLNGLELNMERVRSFVQKLRLITDTNSPNRMMKLTVGPTQRLASASQAVPMTEREPASLMAQQDSSFYPKPTQDPDRGVLISESARDYASIAIRIDYDAKRLQLQEQGVLDLVGTLWDKQALLQSTPDIQPCDGWFSSGFGYRISPFTHKPEFHPGLDIAAPFGTPVVAPADGVVIFAGYDAGGYGNLVKIDQGYGVVTYFGHNSRIKVHVGEHVKRGQVISYVGSTGRSTGPHCHYEVHINGVAVDPLIYIL